jgi:predicted acylesterase/phospholipase RssA
MPATNQHQPVQPDAILQKKLTLIDRARQALETDPITDSASLKALSVELERSNQFAYATEVLWKKMEDDREKGLTATLEEDYHKLSVYIYKDHSLPSSFKFERALHELQSHDDLSRTKDCETLGLTGAIYKRKWQFDHQFKNLILSRHYYKRGYESWLEHLSGQTNDDNQNDFGYSTINYAYVSELMAVDELEQQGAITGVGESVIKRLVDARTLREFILTRFVKDIDTNNPSLQPINYFKKGYDNAKWVLATVAEALFGLRRYDHALVFITKYLQLSVDRPWELKTFSQQLFSMAYLQQYQKKFFHDYPPFKQGDLIDLRVISDEIDAKKIYQCIAPFFKKNNNGDSPIVPEIKRGGKLGLALSGGGFRASLFHIGVLAALAEKDELRNIEVLSCVSGGSIIGAYYYLKLKELLQRKSDNSIDKSDYIKLVQETETAFLKGIQKNLRVKIFSDIRSNIKMLFDKKYSRSHRLGELYEEYLFQDVFPYEQKESDDEDATDNKEIYMKDLFIKPNGIKDGFDIAQDNWQRKNKVPQLILNATSVNTGHNWQFTASWMGEPPGNIEADIDVKPRLRRMYYEQAPGSYKTFRLGYAVAASSCVPVMFHPMPMYDLYDDINLQLIDGGLHDNQGIAALIEQECANMIISDASGQLPTEQVSSENEAALFYRADNILQERLRELQFMDLNERNYTTQLNHLLTMHLKNGLQQDPVSWIDCIDPPRKIVYAPKATQDDPALKYGVLKKVQTRISEIRTDLDAFSEMEAYALMYSGYAQTHYAWNEQNKERASEPDENLWKFSAIKEYVTNPEKASQIEKVLKNGNRLFLKVLYLSTSLQIVTGVILIAAAIGLGFLIWKFWNMSVLNISFTVKVLVLSVALFILGRLIKGIGFLVNRGAEIRKWMVLLAVVFLGTILCFLYLEFLNPLYMKIGKLKKK